MRYLSRLLPLAFIALITLGCRPGKAPQTATITLDPHTTYQTMTGWEATAQAGQFEFPTLFAKYKDTMFDMAANDLGVNRIRLEIYPGIENPVDWFAKALNGEIRTDDWIHTYGIQIVNDNADPNVINWNGFQFTWVDHQIDNVILPMKRRLEARGEKLFVNATYVDFEDPPAGSCAPYTCIEHRNAPEEYAELVLAVHQHMQTKYGFVPDSWEVILEPDNSAWGDADGLAIGKALYAAAVRLRQNGYATRFVAPSVTNMDNLLRYISGIKAGIKQQGHLSDAEVDQFISQNMAEYSYHRYGTNNSLLPALVADAKAHGINTSQLEHINADVEELQTDLKAGNNSAWSQFTLGYPNYPGNTDDGGFYYIVNYPDVNNPDPNQYQVSITSRTKFLRQYFKYIRAGAVRIEASTTNGTFDPVAFINTNGGYVVVVKAAGGGSFSVQGLPAGRYGIKYTTDSQYDVDAPDVTVSAGEALSAQIPARGVITVYAKGAPAATATPTAAATAPSPPTATPTPIPFDQPHKLYLPHLATRPGVAPDSLEKRTCS